ncbi:MAG: hypothetical protein ABW195_16990, partial [Ilumatobacteraceae bacterium]
RSSGVRRPADGRATPSSTSRPGKRPESRPELRLVPRPRAAANAAIVLVGVVVVLMLAAVVLHTRLAERQLEIDRLEASVTDARERFDVLRQQRAELRSPTRLAIESRELGMIVAPQSQFLAVDPQTLAEVIAAAGTIDESTGAAVAEDPLDQIRRVKAATAGEIETGGP